MLDVLAEEQLAEVAAVDEQHQISLDGTHVLLVADVHMTTSFKILLNLF